MKKEYDFSKGKRGWVVKVPPGNYQTLVNHVLGAFTHQKQESLETTLRRVIRDELRRAGNPRQGAATARERKRARSHRRRYNQKECHLS